MNKRIHSFLAAIALTLAAFAQVEYVNPMIGTDGMGHTFPGACVPFGIVQLSPDTDTIPHNVNGKYQKGTYAYCAGYQYHDKTIVGFSHTHFSGTGHSDLGDILVMPTTGALKLNPGTADNPDGGYRSRFSHDTERAMPGYYEVQLDDYNVKAQLTATPHVGVHKYTFPKEGDGRIVPQRVRITEAPPPELLIGMSIVAEIVSYPRGKMDATARVTSVLGWPQDNGVDVTAIMHRHALRDTFPQEVLSESEALSEEISAEEYATREDWRQEPVFTIDPESARDYDDAICVKEYADYTELAVHIADVSHYVKPGSALDAEAYLRGNSTYLPDRVLPMLPPKLCDNICSLKEGVDRLTKLCVMRINRKGEVFRAEFKSAVICSIRRLSYGQALAVIEGRDSTGSEQLDTALHVAHKLAEKMRRLRLKNGALDLQIPELRIEVDAQGKVADIQQEYSDAAHQMIEEFMLAANEAVAAALTRALTPTIYRIHEEPDASKLQSFAYMVRDYGIKAGSLSSRKELMAVVEQIKGHSDEQILTTALLRSMMRARYSTRAMGHFGLAKNDYCHFTSPIRRYADLIVHRGFNRLVFGKNARVNLPDMGRLAEIAEHISETERSSAAAEHEAKQVKITAFLAEECESEHPRVWQAVITDSYPQGLAVEVQMLQVKGFISGEKIEEALGARWYFERHTRRWSSTEGEYLYPGCRIDVVPCYVDELSGFVDFKPSSSE